MTLRNIQNVREISQTETEKSPELVNPILGQFVRLLGPRRPRPVLVLWTFTVEDNGNIPSHSFPRGNRPDQMMLAPRDVAYLLERKLRDFAPRRFVGCDLNMVTKAPDIVEILPAQRGEMICGGRDRQDSQAKLKAFNDLPC